MITPCPLPSLYAHEGVQVETGPTIRPGGFVLTDRALDLCRFAPKSLILDVGCGHGATVHRLHSHWNLTGMGMDPSPGMLTHGKGLPLIQGTGEVLPVADARLDGILCECVLGATPDTTRILKECFRILKPGGRMIVTDIYARNPLQNGQTPLPMTCCFNGARALADHVRTIGQQGFTPLHVEDHSRLLRDLAAHIVWNHGSLAGFWAAMFPALDTTCILSSIAAIKPGLFLCVARKEFP
ncbi:MAG: DVU_1556 family methyltransferase [Desulfoplanes sp.]